MENSGYERRFKAEMSTNREKLRTGDVVQLIAPAYGEPDGLCTVIADQAGSTGLVWFTAGEQASPYRGPCYVTRRKALRLVKRLSPSNGKG